MGIPSGKRVLEKVKLKRKNLSDRTVRIRIR